MSSSARCFSLLSAMLHQFAVSGERRKPEEDWTVKVITLSKGTVVRTCVCSMSMENQWWRLGVPGGGGGGLGGGVVREAAET